MSYRADMADMKAEIEIDMKIEIEVEMRVEMRDEMRVDTVLAVMNKQEAEV
jgi:hypothetical protein